MSEELIQQANTEKATYEANFNALYNDLLSKINTYSSLYSNYNNINQLNNNYINENNNLNDALVNESDDVLTNERKTFYEDQSITNLNSYYYYLLYIYIILFIIHLAYMFYMPSTVSLFRKISILIFLLLLPLFSGKVLSLIIYILHKLYNLLPKNVYTTL